MRTIKLGLICGDGIGKEVIPAAQQVLEKLSTIYDLKFQFQHLEAGFELFKKTKIALPPKTITELQSCEGALFGAVSSPSHKMEGYSSPIVALRKKLDLYGNIRPILSSHSGTIKSPFNNVDMVIVRENTECLYIKDEEITTNQKGEKVAIARRRISEYASRRIGELAFKLALSRAKLHNREPKVTIVHKSNVLSITDGLFRETVRSIPDRMPEFKSVIIEEQLIDSMVYRLFREPHMFDVIVAPNLYGDILSDGAAALIGSLGLVPSANIGTAFAMGEPVHGSAPDIVGQNKANPIASIRSAALLLQYLNLPQAAKSVCDAVESSLGKGILTPDLGGTNTTRDMTEAVCSALK